MPESFAITPHALANRRATSASERPRITRIVWGDIAEVMASTAAPSASPSRTITLYPCPTKSRISACQLRAGQHFLALPLPGCTTTKRPPAKASVRDH